MNPSKKKLFITISVFFIIIALTFLLWGGWMAGWDILGWFTTTQAYILYFMIGFYLIFVIGILVDAYVLKK